MSQSNDVMQRQQLHGKRAKQIQMIVFDFDGVFTDNRVLTMQDGREAVFCWRGDGLGVAAVKSLGINVLVISTETNSVVSERCRKLEIPCIQACKDKRKALKREVGKFGISLECVAYMGNDINDLECLEMVGLPVCVADAHPDVITASSYVTNNKGGYGAVREFCDYIVKLRAG
jgi:YrbI family 3-deoxy-D-manno-octulosonate 8-phosphate phosphatase